MVDWLVQAAKRALSREEDISLAKANRPGFHRRRVSKEEKARIAAECLQPGACLKMVAERHRVAADKQRDRVRLVGGGVAGQLPFVPVVVYGLPSADTAEIEAGGAIERIPAGSSATRVVAVAAYLGRLA